MVYLRYSVLDALGNPMMVTDIKKVGRFKDLTAAKEFISRKEEASRFPIFSCTVFRKERGREINLLAYSRDGDNNLKSISLV